MNKYQVALNTIMCETCHIGEVGEPIQVIKELVDKETPIKPIKLENGKYTCDSCAMAFTVKYLKNRFLSHTYCDVCGQKIDWSVE